MRSTGSLEAVLVRGVTDQHITEAKSLIGLNDYPSVLSPAGSRGTRARTTSGILLEVFGLRLIYLLAALATFGLLVLIETQFDSGFIRFTFGDVLVVVLVYALLMATGCITPVVAAALSLALAYAVEIGQAIDIVDRLGIEPNRLTDIVLGNTFTWSDIIAYTVGAAAALGIDLTIRRVWSPAGTPAT